MRTPWSFTVSPTGASRPEHRCSRTGSNKGQLAGLGTKTLVPWILFLDTCCLPFGTFVLMSPRIILLMGVAGSGKTTIGRRLAAELGWPYHEADDFHSAASKDRMARGLPLDDHDRAPWLASIRAAIDDCLAAGRSAVFTCSALKEKYRRVLLHGTSAVSLVHLAGDPTTILPRVSQPPGHNLKPVLAHTQSQDLAAPPHSLTP